MNSARTLIPTIATVALLATWIAPTTTDAAAAVPMKAHRVGLQPSAEIVEPTGPTVVAEDNDQDLLALGQWALDRFETAALLVPAVEIHMHKSNADCGGHRGTFNPTANRINVCDHEPLVVLHEIAHAWAHEYLTEQERAAFVAAGGFESWNAAETAWLDRGSEHAADAIAWGLLDEPQAMFTEDGPIAQKNAEFRLLTGSDAPRFVRPE